MDVCQLAVEVLGAGSEAISDCLLSGRVTTGGFCQHRDRVDHIVCCGDVLGFGGELCRSEEHTSELQSLMRISYAVFCLKKKIYYSLFFSLFSSFYFSTHFSFFSFHSLYIFLYTSITSFILLIP